MGKSNHPSIKQNIWARKRWLILGVPFLLVAVGMASLIGIHVFYAVPQDYLQAATSPLDDELVRNGAVKKCTVGDGKVGTQAANSTAPLTVDVAYEINKNEADTTTLIKKVAADNGYTLTYFTNGSAIFYTDSKGKPSTYPGYNGNITIGFIIYNDRKLVDCAVQPITSADDTIFALSLSLPQHTVQ